MKSLLCCCPVFPVCLQASISLLHGAYPSYFLLYVLGFVMKVDLTSAVETAKSECLNESGDHTFSDALHSGGGYLESECDEQVLVLVGECVLCHIVQFSAMCGMCLSLCAVQCYVFVTVCSSVLCVCHCVQFSAMCLSLCAVQCYVFVTVCSSVLCVCHCVQFSAMCLSLCAVQCYVFVTVCSSVLCVCHCVQFSAMCLSLCAVQCYVFVTVCSSVLCVACVCHCVILQQVVYTSK